MMASHMWQACRPCHDQPDYQLTQLQSQHTRCYPDVCCKSLPMHLKVQVGFRSFLGVLVTLLQRHNM